MHTELMKKLSHVKKSFNMTKLRGFSIRRKVMTAVEDKATGKVTQELRPKWFTCRRNAAIPDDHRMLY